MNRGVGVSRTANTVMGLFRIFRPITIEARQCRKAETIVTDLGFANMTPGDWVISGEDGERYSVSDDFFHRTFAPVDEQQLSDNPERKPYQTHLISGNAHSNQSGCVTGGSFQGPRTRYLTHFPRKRRLGMPLVHGRRDCPRAARTSFIPSSPHK